MHGYMLIGWKATGWKERMKGSSPWMGEAWKNTKDYKKIAWEASRVAAVISLFLAFSFTSFQMYLNRNKQQQSPKRGFILGSKDPTKQRKPPTIRWTLRGSTLRQCEGETPLYQEETYGRTRVREGGRHLLLQKTRYIVTHVHRMCFKYSP